MFPSQIRWGAVTLTEQAHDLTSSRPSMPPGGRRSLRTLPDTRGTRWYHSYGPQMRDAVQTYRRPWIRFPSWA